MKFTAALAALSFGSMAFAQASTVSVSYDSIYDNASGSTSTIACSDGANGLITKYGYSTFGAIPSFPRIGGSSTIPSWNAATCGQCYAISYKGKTINVLAIDTAPSGFNMAHAAMDKLTGGQATQLGRVTANIKKVGVSKCGLTPKRDLREIEFTA